MSLPKVWFVTDPLCSWCWGMANDVAQLRAALAGRVDFDLMLGGINVEAVTPLNDALLPRFQGIWQRVSEMTGQTFGMRFPAGGTFVYNSLPVCRALLAVRGLTQRPPFAYLHALQEAFFLHARDTTNADGLTALAVVSEGVSPAAFRTAYGTPALADQLEAEMRVARGYGTAALPSVLVEAGGVRRLLAGGYASAAMLGQMVEDWLGSLPIVPK